MKKHRLLELWMVLMPQDGRRRISDAQMDTFLDAFCRLADKHGLIATGTLSPTTDEKLGKE